MAHLINKDPLVAEINKRLSYYKDLEERNFITEYAESGYCEIKQIKQLLDTTATKDVDLDYIKKELDELIRVNKPNVDFGWGTLYNVATHFFELGMQVSNKTQKGEKV